MNYGVRLTSGLWWIGENRFASHPIAAKWFATEDDAFLTATRDLPDVRTAWNVEPIPESATTEQWRPES